MGPLFYLSLALIGAGVVAVVPMMMTMIHFELRSG